MKIFINIISEPGERISLDLQELNTIGDIKSIILNKEGILPQKYRLIFIGKVLSDEKTLFDYNI